MCLITFFINVSDSLLVTIPLHYNFPVTNFAIMDGELEGIWLSDANGDFGKASFRSFNDVDGFKIQVSDLTPTCTDSVCGSTKYKVSFKLTNPAYEQTIDVTTFTCATQNAGADVSVASGDEMFYFKDSALTEYSISLNGAANDVQVSTDST